MANLRADNLTGTGGRNAIDGSVFFRGYIDGTNSDYLKTADLDDYDVGTGDFTFECWIKVAQNQGDYAGIFGMYDYDNAGMLFQINNTGVIRLVNPTQIAQTGSTVLWGPSGTMGSWQHIAVARSGSTLKAFINGISEISVSYTHGIDFANGGGAVIGVTDIVDHPGDLNIRGYVSNLRLIKGSALYTANFTPPTEKLTAVAGTVLLCCQDSDDPTQEATGKTITGYGNLNKVTDDVELVTNGHFNSDISGWTVGQGAASWNSGQADLTSPATTMRQTLTTVVGKTYRMEGTANDTGNTSNNIGITLGSRQVYVPSDSFRPAARTFTAYWTATSTTTSAQFWGGTDGTGKWSNISVKLAESPKQSSNSLPPVGVDEGVTFGGETKHNTQGYMYFPTGDTSQRGRGRGLTGGGFIAPGAPTPTIQSIQIQSEGTGLDFGDLTVARMSLTPMSSVTRGLFAGGYTPTNQDVIDYVEIATTGNAVDFGNMAAATKMAMGASNSTRGLMAGGDNINTIQYVTIANAGNTTDFGDLLTASKYGMGCASPTRAIWFLGAYPSNINTIEYTTIATTGNSVDFGDRLFTSSFGGAACSSSTRGVLAGGYNHPTVNQSINYVEIATTGNATDFGDLQQAIGQGGSGMSNGSRGVFGGYWGPTTTGAGGQGETNICEYVTIATTGNAKDWGDLYQQTYYCTGVSDSHGGLS